MDKKLRNIQLEVLKLFSNKAKKFALCGGTALELCYLDHRFSVDLDFFSPEYDVKEVEKLIAFFEERLKVKVRLEADFVRAGRARIRFYTIQLRGQKRPLKLDFVEDVLIKSPKIKKTNGIRAYCAKNIYFQKIAAVTGTQFEFDQIGRRIAQGRQAARDVYDIYMLSKKIMPLHLFLSIVPEQFRRGMVHWYRSFSRNALKLELLDLDIYDKNFDSQEMIQYLEDEIKLFVRKGILK
jgi:predicted nucleotidyltransferase component of viral defense system